MTHEPSPIDSSEARRSSRTALALLGTVLGAFFARCLYIGDVFLDKRVLPFGPDSSYHLWRIEEAVWSGLSVPRWDPFLNATEGAAVIYPDGFDAFLAFWPWLFHGADATRFDIQTIVMVALPILGALGCLAAYVLARRVVGRAEGVVAAVACAVLPIHIYTSMLGRVDHHIVELVLPALALVVLLAAREQEGRPFWVRVVGAGALLAALVYGAPTALLHILLVAVAVGVAALRASYVGDASGRRLLQALAGSAAVAALLTLPDALTRTGFAFYEPSALPTLLLAGVAVGAGLLIWVGTTFQRLAMAALGTGIVGLAAVFWLLPGASGFVARSGMIGMLTESQPVWANPMQSLQFHSALLPLFPIGFVWLALRWKTPDAWALMALGLAGFVLAMLQVRFGVVLAIPAAVVLGAAAVAVSQMGKAWIRLVLVAVLAASLWWPVTFLSRAGLATTSQLAVLETADWLRHVTPSAGERGSGEKADYSVLSYWGDGTHLAYLAERPMVVGAFYHGDFEAGFQDALQMFYGDDDPTPLLEQWQVRYVALPARSVAADRAHRSLLDLPEESAVPPLYGRLFDTNGAAIADGKHIVSSLRHFRLVHESPLTLPRRGQERPAMRVFERVPGALLSGSCAEGLVQVKTPITTDQGNTFDYVDAQPCAKGKFALRFPYAGVVLVKGPGTPPSALTVREEDVMGGLTVPVP